MSDRDVDEEECHGKEESLCCVPQLFLVLEDIATTFSS